VCIRGGFGYHVLDTVAPRPWRCSGPGESRLGATGATRADLPPLPAPDELEFSIEGLIDFPPQKVFVLGEGEDRDPGWPKVLQQVRLELQTQQLGVRLLPMVLCWIKTSPADLCASGIRWWSARNGMSDMPCNGFALAAALVILLSLGQSETCGYGRTMSGTIETPGAGTAQCETQPTDADSDLRILRLAAGGGLGSEFQGWLYANRDLEQRDPDSAGAPGKCAGLFDTHDVALNADYFQGKWTLLYRHVGDCGDTCHQALYTVRQVRLAQGKNIDRVQRLLLLEGAAMPAWVSEVVEHYPGLTVARRAIGKDAEVFGVAGQVYLVDPLGNVMMEYALDANPRGMIKDLERLLRISYVG